LNPSDPCTPPEQHPAQIRPVLADPLAAEARFHLRQPIYRRLARHTISTSGLTPEETVAAVLTRLTQPLFPRR
jgi:shikimate kinase